jgi:hypothetical protein
MRTTSGTDDAAAELARATGECRMWTGWPVTAMPVDEDLPLSVAPGWIPRGAIRFGLARADHLLPAVAVRVGHVACH